MNRDKLLSRICPVHIIYDCCNSDTNFDCKECKRVMNDWLDEYDKQIRADEIDDFANWLVEQGILGNRCISDGEITDYGKVMEKYMPRNTRNS